MKMNFPDCPFKSMASFFSLASVNVRKDKMLVGCLYKSLSSNTENLEELNKLIIEVSKMKEFSHLLISGDFNFPNIDWKTWTSREENGGEKFLESMRESYLIQHVTEVTRVRDNSELSILDLILTNEENMIDEIIYSSPLVSFVYYVHEYFQLLTCAFPFSKLSQSWFSSFFMLS
jgi:hypothetical protein